MALIGDLVEAAQVDPAVVEVRIHGSGAYPAQIDRFSDLDVDVIVDGAASTFSGSAWPARYGIVWAWQHQCAPDRTAMRIVYRDGRRLDASVIQATDPEPRRGSLAYARDDHFTQRPSGPVPADGRSVGAGDRPAVADPAFALAMEFRFEAVQAAAKAARNDVLISAHLALGLAQKVLVLGMLLRDRAEGTSLHRSGAAHWNEWADQLDLGITRLTQAGVLDAISRIAGAFDDAASLWGDLPHVSEDPLLALLRAAGTQTSGRQH